MFVTSYRSCAFIATLFLALCVFGENGYAAAPPVVVASIEAVTRVAQPIHYSISFTNTLVEPVNLTSRLAQYIEIIDQHGNTIEPIIGQTQMNYLRPLNTGQTVSLRSTLQESGYHLVPGKYEFRVSIPCYPSKVISRSKRFAFTILN